MASEKKTTKITVNTAEAQEDLKALRAELKQTREEYKSLSSQATLLSDSLSEMAEKLDAMEKSGKKGTAEFKALEEEFNKGSEKAKELKKAMGDTLDRIKTDTSTIKYLDDQLSKCDAVIKDLANSSLRQLSGATRESARQLRNMSENSEGLEDIHDRMEKFARQTKIVKGEFVNVSKGIGDLSNQSDKWLSKALKSQQDLVASLKKTDTEYENQLAILKRLEAEEARRKAGNQLNAAQAASIARTGSFQTQDASGATVTQTANLREMEEAKKRLTQLRADSRDETQIKDINEDLADLEKRIKAVTESAKDTKLSWVQAMEVMSKPAHFNAEDIKQAMDAIQERIKKLPAGSRAVEQLRAEYAKLEQTLKGTRMTNEQLYSVISRAKNHKASIDELKRAYKQLEEELQKIEDVNGKAFKNQQKDMQALKKEIDKVTGAAEKQGSTWKTAMHNLTAYVGLFAVFNKAKELFVDFFNLNLKFSDQLVNIRKVSNLAMGDIERMANSLAKIDTRTTIEELNQIAYAGAKLGIGDLGVEALESFTRAANQVNVALKEDLGEEALTALSKITEVMGLIPKMGVEDAMLHTGSAIFKLASTSTATSGAIINFSNRMLSLGKQAALSTADILALGAAVDSMALEPEVAATAFGKLVNSIRKGTLDIEKDLGIAEGTLKQFVEQGKGMDAIITIFQKMGETGNVFALDGLFKDLGSDGERLIKTMVTMADKNGMLSKAVKTANDAFREGTAITAEYRMQQETAQAYLERSTNLWEKFFVNAQNANGPIHDLSKAWYEMTKSLLDAGESTGGFKLTIDALVWSIKMLIALIPGLVAGLMSKGIGAAFSALIPIVTTFFSTVKTGFISFISASNAASAASGGFIAKIKAMDAAMRANVIGLFVGLVIQAVYWFSQWESKLTSLQKAQKAVNDLQQEAARNIQDQVMETKALNDVAHDQNAALEDRIKAVNRLNEIVPAYNGQIDETTGKLTANTKALKQFNDELLRQAEIEGAKAKISELSGDLAAAEAKRFQEQKKLSSMNKPKEDYSDVDPFSGFSYGFADQAQKYADQQDAVRAAQQEVDDAKATLKALTDIYGKDIRDTYIPQPDGQGVGNGDDKGKGKGKSGSGKTNNEQQIAKDRANALIANIKAFYEEQERLYLEWVTKMNETDEKVSKEAQAKRISEFEQHKEEALGYARRSIANLGTEWQTYLKDELPKHVFAEDEISNQLIEAMKNSDIKGLHDLFVKLSGDLSRENNKTLAENLGALLDQMFANGSTELRKAAEKVLERQRELQDMLTQFDYTGTVDREYRNRLDKYELLRPAQGVNDKSPDGLQKMNAAYDRLITKARSAVSELYKIDPESEQFATEFNKYLSVAADGFDFANLSAQELKVLYLELIKYTDSYTEAQKRAYDRAKKIADQSWQAEKRNYELRQKSLENEAALYGSKGTFVSNLGLADLKADPEVMLMQLKMQMAEDYYAFVLKNSKNQQLIQEADKARQEQELAYMQSMAKAMKDRLSQMKSLTDPIVTFGSAMGDAFAQMQDDAESAQEAIKNALKSMLKSWGEMAIKSTSTQMWEAINDATINKKVKGKAQQGIADARANADATAVDVNLEAPQGPQGTATDPIYIKNVDGTAPVSGSSPAGTTEGWHDGMKPLNSSVVGPDLKDQKKHDDAEAKQAKKHSSVMGRIIADKASNLLGIEEDNSDAILDTQDVMNKAVIAGFTATGAQLMTAKKAQNAEMNAEDAKRAEASVTFSMAGALAKCFEFLGPIGGPIAAAMVEATLMGILQWALGSAFSGKKKTNTGVNTKLASRMLTYDSGNLYLADNGQIYSAQEGTIPARGARLLTSPTATTVNGQRALVAENGPELVVGRETTRYIQQNDPELLRTLITYDRNHSGRHAHRAYDDGNLSDVSLSDTSTNRNIETSTAANNAALMQAMAQMTTLLQSLNDNGIKAYFDMWGYNGAMETLARGQQFKKRH